MQIIIEQSRPTSSPFNLPNFERLLQAIESLQDKFIDTDETNSAKQLLQKHEQIVAAFVQRIMHTNVAVYAADSDAANEHKRRSGSFVKREDEKGNHAIEVRLDTPRKWVGAILHYLGLFVACESELSLFLNQALTKDRTCGDADESGNCNAPCTLRAAEAQKGLLAKLNSKLNSTLNSKLNGKLSPQNGAKAMCEYNKHMTAESRKKDIGRIWSTCGLRGLRS
jgi:hypothetical protein